MPSVQIVLHTAVGSRFLSLRKDAAARTLQCRQVLFSCCSRGGRFGNMMCCQHRRSTWRTGASTWWACRRRRRPWPSCRSTSTCPSSSTRSPSPAPPCSRSPGPGETPRLFWLCMCVQHALDQQQPMLSTSLKWRVIIAVCRSCWACTMYLWKIAARGVAAQHGLLNRCVGCMLPKVCGPDEPGQQLLHEQRAAGALGAAAGVALFLTRFQSMHQQAPLSIMGCICSLGSPIRTDRRWPRAMRRLHSRSSARRPPTLPPTSPPRYLAPPRHARSCCVQPVGRLLVFS